MNKNDFLARLRTELASLPFEEGQSAVRYYEEYFADAGEDREDDILRELGSPEMLAATILGGYSSAPARVADVQGYASAGYSAAAAAHNGSREQEQQPWYRRTPLWVLILLAICLIPVILPFIAAVGGLCLGVIGTLVGVIVALAAFCLSGVIFGICGVVIVVVGFVRMVLNPAVGILTAGIGLLLLAVGILVTLATIWLLTNVVPSAFRAIASFMGRIFKKGGNGK